MANKQTIQDVDAALDHYHRRLTATVRKIDELRAKRKKMVTGKIKVPPPPGVKHKIEFELQRALRERVWRSSPVIWSPPGVAP